MTALIELTIMSSTNKVLVAPANIATVRARTTSPQGSDIVLVNGTQVQVTETPAAILTAANV